MAKSKNAPVSATETVIPEVALESDAAGEIPVAAPAQSVSDKAKASAAPAKDAVFAYLGPTIRGVITNGAILIGQKDDIVSAIKARAEIAGYGSKMGDIARLVVPDVGIAKTKAQLLEGGNSLGVAFNRILADT